MSNCLTAGQRRGYFSWNCDQEYWNVCVLLINQPHFGLIGWLTGESVFSTHFSCVHITVNLEKFEFHSDGGLKRTRTKCAF